MNIRNINVPITLAASVIIFLVGGSITIDYRFLHAADYEQFQYQQAVRDDRQWLELLEIKHENAKTKEEKDRILRQMKRTEESLSINMGKSK